MGGLRMAATAVALIASASAVHAQAAIERTVSLPIARAIIEGTLEQCERDGHRVVVVVVGASGEIKGMMSHDGTHPHNVELARRKAYTARTFRQTTEEFRVRTEAPQSSGLRVLPGMVWTGGGVPIKIGNETIGGVGVSGAPGGPRDEACANAGLAKAADLLK